MKDNTDLNSKNQTHVPRKRKMLIIAGVIVAAVIIAGIAGYMALSADRHDGGTDKPIVIDNGSNASSDDSSSDDKSDKKKDDDTSDDKKADDKTPTDKQASDRVITEFNKHMAKNDRPGLLDIDTDTLITDQTQIDAVKQRLHECIDALRQVPESSEPTPAIDDVMRKYWYGDLTGNAFFILSLLWSDPAAVESDVHVYSVSSEQDNSVKVSFVIHSDAANMTRYYDGWYSLRVKQFKISDIGE